ELVASSESGHEYTRACTPEDFYNEDDWYEDFHHGNFAFDDTSPLPEAILDDHGKCFLVSLFTIIKIYLLHRIYCGKEDLRIIKNFIYTFIYCYKILHMFLNKHYILNSQKSLRHGCLFRFFV
ncbi:hypothetical protein ACJX0J_039681, partial [Zea mays]